MSGNASPVGLTDPTLCTDCAAYVTIAGKWHEMRDAISNTAQGVQLSTLPIAQNEAARHRENVKRGLHAYAPKIAARKLFYREDPTCHDGRRIVDRDARLDQELQRRRDMEYRKPVLVVIPATNAIQS